MRTSAPEREPPDPDGDLGFSSPEATSTADRLGRRLFAIAKRTYSNTTRKTILTPVLAADSVMHEEESVSVSWNR